MIHSNNRLVTGAASIARATTAFGNLLKLPKAVVVALDVDTEF